MLGLLIDCINLGCRYSLTMRNVNLTLNDRDAVGLVLLFINYEECKSQYYDWDYHHACSYSLTMRNVNKRYAGDAARNTFSYSLTMRNVNVK